MKRIFLLTIILTTLGLSALAQGPDRAFENVNGAVKSITTYEYYDVDPAGKALNAKPDGTWVTEFDTDGYYIDNQEVTRDDNDYITVIMPSNPAYSIFVEWQNGRVVKRYNPITQFDGAFTCFYTYDSEGHLTKEDNKGSEAGDFTITYEYLDFDSRGNWTKRIANTAFADCYEDDEEEPCNQQVLQTRAIVYY